ncbi:MAG: prolipoprotein diacylglyceryl transferase [Proteobacteria bacterium]|nr:prolipoprotein diacylglyceryl transferase [Pseudomonadota bacterium]MCP4916279.1 prolipoprotein diacylglyceryl transferase [Pseudomonadota bacterium]
MHPVLFEIGPLSLHSYGAGVGLALLIGMWLPSFLTRNQEGWPKDFFWFTGLVVGPTAVFFSRLEYVRQHWSEKFADDPGAILAFSDGGVVFHGGVIGAFVGLWLVIKIKEVNVWKAMDAIAPAVGFGLLVARLGCFGAGCCYGGPTDLPWGVLFDHPDSIAPGDVVRHPTQLYASLYGLALGIGLLWLYPRRRFDGQVILVAGILYPILRSFNEMVRNDGERGYLWEAVLGQTLTPAQGFSLVLAALSLYGWLTLSRRAS